MKTERCEDVIQDQLKSRLDTFTNIIEASSPSGDEDAREGAKCLNAEGLTNWSDDEIEQLTEEDVAQEAGRLIYKMPLSIELTRMVRVDLPTSGPADWFEVFVDSEGEPTRIVYHFDQAESTLKGPEIQAAWDMLIHFVEPALDGWHSRVTALAR